MGSPPVPGWLVPETHSVALPDAPTHPPPTAMQGRFPVVGRWWVVSARPFWGCQLLQGAHPSQAAGQTSPGLRHPLTSEQ